MNKRIKFLTILLLGFLILLLTLITDPKVTVVKASSEISVYISEGYNGTTGATYVNQTLPITATPQDGTPPYTYQWYIDDCAISGAINATFMFSENSPGFYRISLKIADSAGNGDYDLFLPAGIWIYVWPLPAPSSTPMPTPSPPNISIISPENKNYTIDIADLNFSLSGPVQWIGFSLDSQANTTLAGNVTLTGLGSGQHTLTVYANDTYGNNAMPQTVTFTVNPPAPFPTTEAVVASVSVIVGVGGGLVYFFKVKPKKK
jgi:hypothetical protein